MCDIYRIKTLDLELIKAEVDDLLAKKKYHEASLIVANLKMQTYYPVEAILLPLLLQDKVTVVEDYIRDCPEAAKKFLSTLDTLIYEEKQHCQLIDLSQGVRTSWIAKPNVIAFVKVPSYKPRTTDKKYLTKLMTRLVKTHNIDVSACPALVFTKTVHQVRFIVYKRYVEVSLSAVCSVS